MFKNFYKQHIFSLRTLLLMLLAGTILYYLLHPEQVIRKRQLETHVEYYPEQMRRFIYLSNLSNLSCMLLTPCSYGLKIHVRDFVTGRKPEVTQGDLIGDIRPWWDDNEQCVRMIVHQRDSDLLELLTVRVDENLNMETKRQNLWRNPPITEVMDSTVVVKGLTFHSPILIDSTRAMDLLTEESGYRIVLSKSTLDSLGGLWAPGIEQIDELHQIAGMISEKTGVAFETKDVYSILQTFRRNSWYKLRFIESGFEYCASYGAGRIEGSSDCNGDGNRELLIATRGDRYLESTISCWDMAADSLLWQFTTAGGSILSFVADIDNDGRDEVGIGTNAPGNQMSPCWHEHPEMGITAISYFYVLDDDGSIFQWGDRLAWYEIGKFGSTAKAFYDKPSNSALVFEQSNMDNSEKHFLQLHLDTGKIDSLSSYRSIYYYYSYGNDIFFWDWYDGKVTRKCFSPGLRFHEDGIFPIENSPNYRLDSPLMIDGEPHFIIDPFSILDDEFNVLFEDHSISIGNATVLPNRLLFMYTTSGADLGYLGVMSFQRNTYINPVAPLLVGFELLLLAIWWAVHTFIMAPIASADKGYIVLWSLFGKFYVWKPLGRASIYRLPKYISFDKKYFSSSVGKLSRDFRCIFHRKLLLMDFTVYELENINELQVVQHIAHELKNRMLVMQYGLAEIPGDVPQELNESVKWCSKASKVISDFSRVHTLNKEPVDIRDVIEETVHSLMARPNAELLDLKLPEQKLIAPIDRYLLKMALRNLIENALQAIDEKGWVRVSAVSQGNSIRIDIQNPGHIDEGDLKRILTKGGWSSKEDGTGVGVSIARIIIGNHDGTLEIACHEDVVETTVMLPL